MSELFLTPTRVSRPDLIRAHYPQSCFRCCMQAYLLCLMLLGISGCFPSFLQQKVEADARPSLNFDIPSAFAAHSTGHQSLVYAGVEPWLSSFNDPILVKLVRRGLHNNYDLRVAANNVKAAFATIQIFASARHPQVSLGGETLRQQSFSSTASDQLSSILSSTWDVDLWGKLSDAEQAAIEDYKASEHDYRAAQLALAVNIAKNWYNSVLAYKQEEVSKTTWKNYKENLKIVESAYRTGVHELLDVWLARSNIAEAKVEITNFRTIRLTNERSLNILLGIDPAKGVSAVRRELPALATATPAGLPSELLKRRPDIQEALSNYRATLGNLLVAKKDLYPSIELTASGGLSSQEISDFFDLNNKIWSLAANLTAPLFLGGRLRAQVQIEKAAVIAAANQYRSVVIQAFREVETALFIEETLKMRKKATEETLHAAQQAETIADQQYRNGLIDYITLLEAQRHLFAAQRGLLTVNNDLIQNRLDLFLYLGGNF